MANAVLSEMEKDLDRLLDQQTLLKAMKQSCEDSDKKLAEDIQRFVATYLGYPVGASFTLLDLIKKVRGMSK
jgi:hypothetical protein